VISHDAVLDLSALLAQADHALYRAKDAGRNRVEIASIELILDRVRRGAADVLAGVGGRRSRPQNPPPEAKRALPPSSPEKLVHISRRIC
jgi:hypothetical protein